MKLLAHWKWTVAQHCPLEIQDIRSLTMSMVKGIEERRVSVAFGLISVELQY